MTKYIAERGGILLYIIICVTFLSGLAAYLQAMSSPVLFQTKDSQQIVADEYLTESFATLLSKQAYDSQDMPKYSTEILNNSSTGINEEFLSTLTKILNRQKTVYLFLKKDILFAVATRKSGDIGQTSVNLRNFRTDPFSLDTETNIDYNIHPYNKKTTSKTLPINIHFGK